MKECTKCHETKELTKFVKHPKTKDKLNSWCKSCTKQATKKWIDDNPNKFKQSEEKWRLKIQGVYAIYENGICLYIGESKQLLKRLAKHRTAINNPLNTGRKSAMLLANKLSQHTHLVFGILEETPNHKERERYWINQLKPKYNEKI